MPRHGLAALGAERPLAMAQASGRGLAGWPIRRKLVALVTVPVLVIIGVGALLTASSIVGLRQAERTRSLATTALATNVAIVALDNELNQTITVIRTMTQPGTTIRVAPASGAKKAMEQRRAESDEALKNLEKYLADPPTGSWSSDVLLTSSGVSTAATQLAKIRKSADSGYSPLVVDQNYEQNVLSSLRGLVTALSRDIATASGTGNTVDQASTLSALAEASFSASDERVRGTIALSAARLSSQGLTDLRTQAITQDAQLNIASSHATPAQQAAITSLRSDDARIEKFREGLMELSELSTQDTADFTAEQKREHREKMDALPRAATFSAATGQRLDTLDSLIGQVAQDTRDMAASNVRGALLRTITFTGLGLVTLMLVFAALAVIARTVTLPMRRLRSGAVEVATARLPAAVRSIEQQGVDAHIDLPPVLPPGLVAGPETVEVAHAVDGLTAEAVRLATSQVRLRHALDEAFVSMSRRSQSMVEKQLSIIDELESVEEDPEQLQNLFRLDHLAARMRRYNDNLLVLAGSSVRTRSNTPVPIADVFRAATSEMEQYERVRLQPVSSAAVGGQVAGGLIHLLAELLDNAAMYSPPTSPILLTANFTPDGGLHLEVSDSGVGIPPAELAELNARLATPGTIDTQIPSRMGLFVVGRLAHRGGFEVRLSPRPTGAGTVAEVLVPSQHVVGAQESGAGAQAAEAAPRLPTQTPRAGLPSAPPAPPERRLSESSAAGLPQRATPPWPPAEDAPAAAGASGDLPSRVPGAALNAGPLGGNQPTEQAAEARFDAFGAFATGGAPPAAEDPSPASSATALWAQRSRGEQPEDEQPGTGASSFGLPADSGRDDDPYGLGPVNGRRSPGGPSGGAPFGGAPPGTPPDSASPFGGAPPGRPPGSASPFGGPPPGTPPDSASLFGGPPPGRPSGRAPFGGADDTSWPGGVQPAPTDDPWAGQQLPRREGRGGQAKPPEPQAPSSPASLFGEALRPSPGDTGGITLPVERMAPLTGEIPLRDINKAIGPNLTLPPPSGLPVDQSSLSDLQQQEPEAPENPLSHETTVRFGRRTQAPESADPSPMEQAARDAAATRYQPADPNVPLIGNLDDMAAESVTTPIFDSISLWFNDETTPPATTAPARGQEPVKTPDDENRFIDLREEPTTTEPAPATAAPAGSLASRWASLGDQQWLATNARAAAQPEVAGDTSAGLPRREPGANLLPSATAAAPSTSTGTTAPFRRADADTVRGRLGSYQRGVSSARRSRQIPTGGTAAGLFTAARTSAEESGREPEDHGGQE